MCGICGIASGDGPPDRARLDAMSAKLVHRGPDSDGAFLDERVGIAARRLSIIDLARRPAARERGRDGPRRAERRDLQLPRAAARARARGHSFRSEGDTEVLAHLYEEHGTGFAERLRGMFSVAIWDSRRGRLVLARDRFGIKPLYYRASEGGLEFASELRALPRGEIDLDALEAFLAFNSIRRR